MRSSLFIVIVEFTLKLSASKSDGKKLLLDNAAASLQNEAGCYQFDVVETDDVDAPFVLYESYRDREAFEDHLISNHYLTFDVAASQIFATKKVRLGTLAEPAAATMEKPENE